MKLMHWIGLASLLALGLAVSMWVNSDVIFLVLRYDPSTGKFRHMEYREEDRTQYENSGLRAPTIAELHELLNEHKSSGEHAVRTAIRAKYEDFYKFYMDRSSIINVAAPSRNPIIGKRMWSNANPFFFALIALSAACAIWCVMLLHQSSMSQQERKD